MQITKSSAVAAAAVFTIAAGSASAATIVSDGFESYADTTELHAVWTPAGTGNAPTLDTSFGNPGQSVNHTGTATVIQQDFAPVTPTAADPLVFSGQIYDDGTSSNERISIGIRSGASNIIELGHYNGSEDAFYHYRLINFASGNPNWVPFEVVTQDNVPTEGWHTYTATVTDTTVTLALDLLSDGVIDATSVENSVYAAAGFSNVRMGGPSGLSSAGGGVNFDNISLITGVIPEPTSLAALGLGGLGLLRRRR